MNFSPAYWYTTPKGLYINLRNGYSLFVSEHKGEFQTVGGPDDGTTLPAKDFFQHLHEKCLTPSPKGEDTPSHGTDAVHPNLAQPDHNPE